MLSWNEIVSSHLTHPLLQVKPRTISWKFNLMKATKWYYIFRLNSLPQKPLQSPIPPCSCCLCHKNLSRHQFTTSIIYHDMQPALLCGPIIDLPPLVRFTNNGVRFIYLESSMIRICLWYQRTLYDKGTPDMVWFLQRHKLIKSITFRVRPLLLRISINIMHIFILSRVLLYSHMIWSECDPSECHSIQSSAAMKGFG